jgi:hypothetical protein
MCINEVHHTLCSASDIIRMMKPRGMSWTGHGAHMWGIRNAQRICENTWRKATTWMTYERHTRLKEQHQFMYVLLMHKDYGLHSKKLHQFPVIWNTAHMDQHLAIIHCNQMAVNDVSFHQRAVTEFPIQENSSVAGIFDWLCHVYGDSYMGASSMWCWVYTSKMAGSRDITNLCRRGQPRTTGIECNVQKVDAFITADWRTTVREIVVQLVVGHSTMQEMKETLGYKNVCCCCWVPHCWQMNTKQHHSCFNNTLQRRWCPTEQRDWWWKLVPPKTKLLYLQRSCSSSSGFTWTSAPETIHTLQRARTITSAEKIMFTLLWNAEGCILVVSCLERNCQSCLLHSDTPQSETYIIL